MFPPILLPFFIKEERSLPSLGEMILENAGIGLYSAAWGPMQARDLSNHHRHAPGAPGGRRAPPVAGM